MRRLIFYDEGKVLDQLAISFDNVVKRLAALKQGEQASELTPDDLPIDMVLTTLGRVLKGETERQITFFLETCAKLQEARRLQQADTLLRVAQQAQAQTQEKPKRSRKKPASPSSPLSMPLPKDETDGEG